ncbi:hypothetical protein TRVA0_009S01926 [Trichomonascus vanleenenianus]|uniref:uncharacterized protein n=1 Tax=Trichomonascus vanleenenianus TaxID=2268995 RepID=UPI003ECA114D
MSELSSIAEALPSSKHIRFYSSKEFQIVLEYCDRQSLLNLQLCSKAFRNIVGRKLWKRIVLMACQSVYRRPRKGVEFGYDRHYPDHNISDSERIVVNWSKLGKFIRFLDHPSTTIHGWVHCVKICIAFKSPGLTMTKPNQSGKLSGEDIDNFMAQLMTKEIPRYFKNLRRITVISGFWADRMPKYPSRSAATPWERAIIKLCRYFPSAHKSLHFRDVWISFKNPQLNLTNVQTLALQLGENHELRLLESLKLPHTLRRFDLIYRKKIDVWSGTLERIMSPCRRLQVINIEFNGNITNTKSEWLPASVVEFGRNYPDAEDSALYPMRHPNMSYLHVHFRSGARTLALYYKHLPNLTKLHVIGPTDLEYYHDGLYNECPDIKQLHCENMPARYVGTMARHFRLKSVVIERCPVEDDPKLSSEDRRRSTYEFYDEITRSLGSLHASLELVYLEMSPIVDVARVTEMITQRISPARTTVIAGDKVQLEDPKRYWYIDTPWTEIGDSVDMGYGLVLHGRHIFMLTSTF